ncbi:MAG: MMPL family transporter [Chitinophagaceae bacterium]|jgi:predicted RND superfamily exporter protein|nr:MMPL family transporter [Chitinophagaceae bacterium]
MWYSLGKWILKSRLYLLIALGALTAFMAYKAKDVKMGYEFARSIPATNEKYIEYKNFRDKFGDDGATMFVGVETKNYYSLTVFNAVAELCKNLHQIKGVEGTLSIPEAVDLVKNDSAKKLFSKKIFATPYTNQAALDSAKALFESLPFYKGLLYNSESNSYVMAVQLNKSVINSPARVALINEILKPIKTIEQTTGLTTAISGLPFIRTTLSEKIRIEINYFLIGSIVLLSIVVLIFFRSFSAMLISLAVVGMGVIWSLGCMELAGYNMSILTALIPPLLVIIGIPNCIYFFNKYHTAYKDTGNREEALITMVGRMGVVTLFCNLAAGIGFAVFYLTKSDLLKEFGVISGLNIMLLFVISLFFVPSVLSYLPPPKPIQMRYLDNKAIEKLLLKIEDWAFVYKKWIYIFTLVVIGISVLGVTKLKSEGHVVDDLPQSDKIYKDLKWFENNFKGVMPLEILIDTKRKNGLFKSLKPIQKINELSAYIAGDPHVARPLSFVEALKFARQAYYGGDSSNYDIPTEYDIPLMAGYIKSASSASDSNKNNKIASVIRSYVDTAHQVARISVNMKDVGSRVLPYLLKNFEIASGKIFDTAHYKVTFTGASVTFLEGSKYIINGLWQSILWAFLLIALCMLYLFKSVKILFCSLVPNVIPLFVTAGVMGWAGIPLKPSTVLVFSVALGIAIDVTIRFLVNYKQELPAHNNDVKITLRETIRHTGLSIVYTSLVLIAGFIVFCFSEFDSTKGLGFLTSLTLLVAAVTNLVLLPALILSLIKKKG